MRSSVLALVILLAETCYHWHRATWARPKSNRPAVEMRTFLPKAIGYDGAVQQCLQAKQDKA